MEKKILFRADGNKSIGLGHLYRLFALVEMLGKQYQYTYLTHISSTTAILPKDYPVKIIPEQITINEEPKWLAQQYDPIEHIIIADGYQFDSEYQKSIKKLGFSLVYIDDLAQEHMYADIVINHSPSLDISNFEREKYTKFLLGTKYALMRPSFLEIAAQDRSIIGIDSAFVCFGGADKLNLSVKATTALLEFEEIKQINVVVGAAYDDKEIYDLEQKFSDRLRVYSNLSEKELLNLMSSCNMAIAPASTICYELCSVKMPILCGFYVENQKNIYRELSKQRAIIEGGDFAQYETKDFYGKIKKIVKIEDFTHLLEKQKQLFDGMSDKRVLGALNRLNLSFRKANENDLMRVYDWSNDKVVRQNSYQSDAIKLEDHKNWFLKKISDKNVLFLIGMVNDNPAGIVRYEIKDEYTVVGVLISKEYRGQKLASTFLRTSAIHYFEESTKPVLAYIKVENAPSIKSFENADYVYFKEETVSGHKSVVYKLERKDVI